MTFYRSLLIPSFVAFLFHGSVRLQSGKTFDFHCFVTVFQRTDRICGNSRSNESLENRKPFERDTNFETEDGIQGPFILEVDTTVAVKRSKMISL